jgi:hypothetical protein
MWRSPLDDGLPAAGVAHAGVRRLRVRAALPLRVVWGPVPVGSCGGARGAAAISLRGFASALGEMYGDLCQERILELLAVLFSAFV